MPIRYIPALIIIFVLIAATIYFYQRESSYVQGMSITSGMVVGLGSRSTFSTVTKTTELKQKRTIVNTQAIVDYQVNGAKYRVKGRAMGYPRWKLGQSVDVYFSAQNPGQSRIKRWDEVYFHTLLSGFFLIACVFFAMINFAFYKIRGRPLS